MITALVASQLVTTLRALPGWQAPDATGTGTPVFDSTEILMTETPGADYVIIGEPGDPSGSASPGGSTSTFAAHAASGRPTEERGTITGMVVAQSGDDGIGQPRVVRDRAYAMLTIVDAALRVGPDGPKLGIIPAMGQGQLLWARLASSSRLEIADDKGLSCEVSFIIEYLARI